MRAPQESFNKQTNKKKNLGIFFVVYSDYEDLDFKKKYV